MVKVYAWTRLHPAIHCMAVDVADWQQSDADLKPTIAQLMAQPAGNRVLMIQNDFLSCWNSIKTDPVQAIVDKVINGPFPNLVNDRAAQMRMIFQRLNIAGAAPDIIVIDNEGDATVPNYWGMPGKNPDGTELLRSKIFAAIYASRYGCKAMLDMGCDYQPADFDWGSPNLRNAVTSFCVGIGRRHLAMVRNMPRLAREAFGKTIPVYAYGDMPVVAGDENTGAGLDINGWSAGSIDNIPTDASWSPVLYCTEGGQLIGNRSGPGGTLKKAKQWNFFIQNINWLRSCTNDRRFPTVPWLAPFCYSGDNVPHSENARWLSTQLTLHCVMSGVKEFLYWNPLGGQPGNEIWWDNDCKYAGALFTGVSQQPWPGQLPMIPFDADEVRTGEWVTKYSKFQSAIPTPPQPAPTPAPVDVIV